MKFARPYNGEKIVYEKTFNDKYENVIYKGDQIRLYNEYLTNSYDALYSETQIKLIELMKIYNFKFFYFNCSPITQLKLIVDENGFVDLKNCDILKIKELQSKDFYYFYENKICDVFYSFLKKDLNNNAYFDFMLLVDNNFNLNNLFEKEFNLIKIRSVEEILINDITFDFVAKKFEQRVIVYNDIGNRVDTSSPEKYIFNKKYDFDTFKKEYYNNSDFNSQHYENYESFHHRRNFNQNILVKDYFRSLCSHIWSMDQIYYIEKNESGLALRHWEEYDLMSFFFTNYAEIVGIVSVDFKKDGIEINDLEYYSCCLMDNTYDQGIFMMSYDKKLINKSDIDISTLNIVDKKITHWWLDL